jgi:hypothetical protein
LPASSRQVDATSGVSRRNLSETTMMFVAEFDKNRRKINGPDMPATTARAKVRKLAGACLTLPYQ